MPGNDLPGHRPNAVLEGDDPLPDEDEFLSGVIPLDHRVSDEEAESFIQGHPGRQRQRQFQSPDHS